MRAIGIALVAFASFTAAALAQNPGLTPVTPTPAPKKVADDQSDKAEKAKKDDAKTAPTRRPMPGFVTFDQNAWAGPEASKRAAKVLAKHFEEAFPEGLQVGVREKGMHSYTLESLKAVRKFLPNGGRSSVLGDDTYESLEDAGALAGQLVAAKINLRFNQRGFLGEPEEGVKTPLVMKELKFQRGVDGNIKTMSVERVVKLADRALAGEFGAPEDSKTPFIDTNNDKQKDVSLDDLKKALGVFNANFEDGENDGRFVAKGYTNEVPVDDKAATTAAGAAGAGAAGAGAAAAAANADDDEDAGDDKLKEARREQEQANDERDRELETAEKEHDDEITKARAEARRSGDSATYETKKAEIDAKFQRKRAEIAAKHQAKLEKFRAKHGRAHPGKGKGLRLEGGPGDAGPRGDDKGKGKDNGKDKRDDG